MVDESKLYQFWAPHLISSPTSGPAHSLLWGNSFPFLLICLLVCVWYFLLINISTLMDVLTFLQTQICSVWTSQLRRLSLQRYSRCQYQESSKTCSSLLKTLFSSLKAAESPRRTGWTFQLLLRFSNFLIFDSAINFSATHNTSAYASKTALLKVQIPSVTFGLITFRVIHCGNQESLVNVALLNLKEKLYPSRIDVSWFLAAILNLLWFPRCYKKGYFSGPRYFSL